MNSGMTSMPPLKLKPLQHREFPLDGKPDERKADERQADDERRSMSRARERFARLDLTRFRPARNKPTRRRAPAMKPARRARRRRQIRPRHHEAAIGKEEAVEHIERLLGTGQRLQDRAVKDENPQQQRDVAEDLDVERGNLRDAASSSTAA